MAKSLFVLTPTGRSGTTLMMSYLHQCSEIVLEDAYPYEFRLLSSVFIPEKISRKTHVLDYPFLELKEEKLSRLSLLDKMSGGELSYYSWLAGKQGKRIAYAAEKLPGFPLHLARQSYSTAKFLIMIRDPRDALASIRAFNRQRGFHGFADQYSNSDEETIFRISMELGAVLDHAADPTCMIVKYEDLIIQPGLELDRVARFLSISSFDFHVPPEHERHRTATSAYASIGRWHTDLSPIVQHKCNQGWERFLTLFGYVG